MQESILADLNAMRPRLRARWRALLQEVPVTSPLAAPEVLAHLMDWTLDEVFKLLTSPPTRRRARSPAPLASANPPLPSCSCGRNPLDAYFTCLTQALAETTQACWEKLESRPPGERDVLVTETKLAVSTVTIREMETFCAVCRHARPKENSASGCAMQTLPVR